MVFSNIINRGQIMENIIFERPYTVTTGVPISHSFGKTVGDKPEGLTLNTIPTADYSNSCWCIFYRGLNRNIDISFECEKSICGFEISFLQHKAAGIYTPSEVILYASENGVDYTKIAEQKSKIAPSSDEICINLIECDFDPVRVSKIRLSFETDVNVYGCNFKIFGENATGSEPAPEYITSPPVHLGMPMREDGFASTVLIYHGFWDKTVNYGEHYAKNTVEGLLPYVAYLDQNGNIKDTMFDSVLFVLLMAKAPSGGRAVYVGAGGDANVTYKSDFDYFADNLFAEGYNMDALDVAYGKVKEALGQDSGKKLNVSVQLPFVYKTKLKFGEIGGVDAYSETLEQRLAIYEYYIDKISAMFESRGYKNLSLCAFYQGCEGIPTAMSGDEEELFIKLNALIHSKGYKATWVPMFLGGGFEKSRELGFDYAYMQPNYMFRPFDRECLADFAEIIAQYGLGAEIEINNTCVSPYNDSFLQERQKYIDYLDYGASYGYMNTGLAFYQGAGPGSINTACLSPNHSVRNLYDRTYRFIKGKYIPENEEKEEEIIMSELQDKAKSTAETVKENNGETVEVTIEGEIPPTFKEKAKNTANKIKEKAVKAKDATLNTGKKAVKAVKGIPTEKKLASLSLLLAVTAIAGAVFGSGGKEKNNKKKD